MPEFHKLSGRGSNRQHSWVVVVVDKHDASVQVMWSLFVATQTDLVPARGVILAVDKLRGLSTQFILASIQ